MPTPILGLPNDLSGHVGPQEAIKGLLNHAEAQAGATGTATTTRAGTVKKAATVAAAVDETDIVATFNSLLENLKTAGVVSTS